MNERGPTSPEGGALNKRKSRHPHVEVGLSTSSTYNTKVTDSRVPALSHRTAKGCTYGVGIAT